VEIAAGDELLGEALRRFPDDPELLTAQGALVETVASLRDYEPPPGSAPTGGAGGGYRSELGGRGGSLPGASLARAEARYERAVALDTELVEARLRLAHVHLLQGRAGEALVDLERVAARTRKPRLLYLARLFEGRAREMLRDAEGAVTAYRACTSQLPHAQSGLLALGRALDRLGDPSGAQAAFASVGTAGARFDPWWSYQAGQPQRIDDLVAELRELAR
jgi:tetratricopeptide (TPR) repeat protein